VTLGCSSAGSAEEKNDLARRNLDITAVPAAPIAPPVIIDEALISDTLAACKFAATPQAAALACTVPTPGMTGLKLLMA